MQLANARLGHFEHRRDLLEVQLLLVVEAKQELLARRQVLDRPDQRGAEARVLAALERVLALVRQMALEIAVLVVAREVLEMQQLVAARVLQQLVIAGERELQLGGDLLFRRRAAERLLELA